MLIQRSDADGLTCAGPRRDPTVKIVDRLESKFVHDGHRLSCAVSGSAVDEIGLLAIKQGQFVTERLAVVVEHDRSCDVSSLNLFRATDVKQQELPVLAVSPDHP